VAVVVPGSAAADEVEPSGLADAVGSGVESSVRVSPGDAVSDLVALAVRVGGVIDRDAVTPGSELNASPGVPSPSPPPQPVRPSVESSPSAQPRARTRARVDERGTSRVVAMLGAWRSIRAQTSAETDERGHGRAMDLCRCRA
jgi:hypothetical protein